MLREDSLVGKEEIEKKVIELIGKTKIPVSVSYVARNLKIPWSSARALLFKLVAEGRLRMMNTTKSWVFYVKEGESQW